MRECYKNFYIGQSVNIFKFILFVTDRCIALVQAACEPIIFTYFLKAHNIQEWTSKHILFQPQIDVNTQFFKFKSTEVNLLSCLIF